MNIKPHPIEVTCRDNTIIIGQLFRPEVDLRGAVMIAPATGIKQGFYAKFASYLAEQGFAVMTYDNRGIGKSLHGKVSSSQASLQCWGELDATAVLDVLIKVFPQTSYHLIGHSAGGQLIGLMPNSDKLSSVFNYACSSGRLKNMAMPYKLKAHYFMNTFIPMSNMIFGHTKSQWVGMGEPLPKKVAAQWRQWCNGQGYVKTAFGKTVFEHYYDELDVPSLWVNATDDEIAINDNVSDMISVFGKMKHHAQTKTLTPSDHDVKDIGHMKFFSSKRKSLWPLATDWLAEHS
ncbi:alpha/beta hydrolase [Thalassotalea sp. LPB0316]|uniref:alpha/beta hydrolase family protein n=1 Tax=Thalassotalea sp. LPB0316 TaxID=2769490 RepID=UPI001867AFFC|nr:alpha/beta fold hydrolase [Thalassotalea sp. LPB0316]QOL24322.1 alpha/beta hydrolase [Thalassotalea sp. LPB0316]